MFAFKTSPKNLKLVVGPDIRPLPTGYWISANHTKPDRTAIGFAVTQGKVFGAGTQGNPLFLVYLDGTAGILESWTPAVAAKVQLALEGTALLLKGGSLVSELPVDRYQARSAVGIKGDKIIHVYLPHTSIRGMALAMKAFGCSDAIQTSFSERTTVWEKDNTLAGGYPVPSLLGADTYERFHDPVILIDPGHGGADGGATSGLLPYPEKYYNLEYGIHAATRLWTTYTATALLTRWGDEAVSLEDRAEMANALDVDVFLSCHNNASGGSGFESFRDSDPDIPLLGPEEQALQEAVHGSIKDKVLSVYGLNDRGLKREDFYVLRKTNVPAVLLEGAFVDHEKDATLLKDPAFLRALGYAAADGIAAYLKLQPRSSGQTAPSVVTKYYVEVEAGSLEDAEAIRRMLSQSYTARIVQK